MGGAADAAVAEVHGKRERRGRHRDGEVDRLAVALRRQRLVCCWQFVGQLEVGSHGLMILLCVTCVEAEKVEVPYILSTRQCGALRYSQGT